MRNLILALTLFFIVTACVPQRSYQEDAIRYFELNGTEQQYNMAIDQLFDLLKGQYSSQNIPENVWQELEGIKSQAITNIKSLLVPAYQSNFSQEEIQQLISFYESDTGQQMVKDQSQLSENQKKVLNEFFNSKVGQKIQSQSESLKTMVGEVSELWSRDLYKEVTEKLEAKGYQLHK